MLESGYSFFKVRPDLYPISTWQNHSSTDSRQRVRVSFHVKVDSVATEEVAAAVAAYCSCWESPRRLYYSCKSFLPCPSHKTLRTPASNYWLTVIIKMPA